MRNATLLAALGGALALAPAATAQCDSSDPVQAGFEEVDIREINQIPQDNVDQLNSLVDAGTITIADIQSLLTNDLEGAVVQFDAVVLSDPILSGIRSAVDGIPGGIHFFVRDLAAADGDVAGRGIQVVDNRGDGAVQSLRVGSTITVCARVQPFTATGGKSMQVGGDGGVYSITQTGQLDPTAADNAALFAPVTVTTDDVHDIYMGQSILDFDQYSDFNGQYVRFEQAEVTAVGDVTTTRPNLLFSSEPTATEPTEVNFYDTSVCFRNDRGEDYFPPDRAPACIQDDFVPPPAGIFNIQGFLTFQGDDGGFDYSAPGTANFVVNPFDPTTDFEVTQAPPTVSVTGPASIPGPADDVDVSAQIVATEGTIASAQVNYRYIVDGDDVETGSATLTNTDGDTYEGAIPAATFGDATGAFVAYSVTATDTEGGTTTTDEQSYLVFDGPITDIATIQRTFDGGAGASPLLTGDAAEFDLDATVQAVFLDGSNYRATIQDDTGRFSGIWLFLGGDDQGLEAGDQITITEATVAENFDLTQLEDLTFEETGTGTPFAPVTLSSEDLRDDYEAYEGVYVRLENAAVVATNADDPSGPFGEFSVTTSTAAEAVRVDDLADGDDGVNFEGDDPGSVYMAGDVLEFVQGPLYYSFSNYKLTPASMDDLGAVMETAVEGRPGEGAARIEAVYPNPAAGTARVAFALDVAGDARVELFDVTGRSVATLVDGPTAAGAHTVDVELGGLAAGVYVVRFVTEGGFDTARLSVVR